MKTHVSILFGLSFLIAASLHQACARPLEEIQNDLVSAFRQAQEDLTRQRNEFLDSKVPDELKALHKKLKENDEEIRKKMDLFLLENPGEKTVSKEMLDQYGTSSRALRETEERISRIRYQAEKECPQELSTKQEALTKLRRELYDYQGGFNFNNIRFVPKTENLPEKLPDLIQEYRDTQEKEIQSNKEKADKFFEEQSRRIQGILLAAKQPSDLDALISELDGKSNDERWTGYSYADPRKDYGGSRGAAARFVCQFQDYLSCKSQNDLPGAIGILDTFLQQRQNSFLARSDILELKNQCKSESSASELSKLTAKELAEKIKSNIQDTESYEALCNLGLLCKEALSRKATSDYSSLSQYEATNLFIDIVQELWKKAIAGERIQLDFSIPRNNYSSYDKNSAFLGLKWREPFLIASCTGYLGKKPESDTNFSQFIYQEIDKSVGSKDWEQLARTEAFFAAMGKNIDTFFMFTRPPGFSEMMVGYRMEKAGLVENAITSYRKALEEEGSQNLLPLIVDRLERIKKEHPAGFGNARK